MKDILKCRDMIAEKYNISKQDSARVVALFNVGKVDGVQISEPSQEKIMQVLQNDFSSVPAAAAAVGVKILGGSSKKKSSHGKKNKSAADRKEPKKRSVNTFQEPTEGGAGQQDDRQTDGIENNIRGAAFGMDGDIIPADMVAASDYDLPDDMGDIIEGWISDFATRYNIDLTRLNSQQWRSCCDFIGQQIKSKGILRDRERERSQGGMIYKPERLEGLLYLWAFFSGVYKQVPLEGDFIAFSGVHRNYFYDYDGRNLTSTRVQIVKKAREIEERGALSAAVGGGSNAVGGMFTLKTRHNYTETPSKPEMIAVVVPSAAALPNLGAVGGLISENVDKLPD